MYGHRGQNNITPRYLELLEALKNEYENMFQEISMSKMHREDVELKSTAKAMINVSSALPPGGLFVASEGVL
ncbi:hypothetical protein PSACC_01175 [Paramicrosporidium saccamoebae]|uniref:Transcriptional repressor Tup1 N-terminal domain-containing protein n=1 Tax=Paramicrosporidium saccamoebae TaxID=1246581 RepID=A0A2H9TMR7_9FUNG|nr:hypothetical protein PSACC_01175 [Paramicrosporidium saccamoebae]